MTVKIHDTPDVQNFLKAVAGFDQQGGSHRGKQILHRLLSDEYTWDDFAFATREELVVDATRIEEAAEAAKHGLEAPFTEVVFDVELAPTADPEQQSRHKRPRALEDRAAPAKRESVEA
ncbi:hypothetical protein [Billgrantia kenyensis]|uniref:hypothetical protein n=1 Tax=Billgrantia kenyensis TaxID=321266 RepID=UPI001EF0B955|nr:hypothetical protein [Halomonas kenyensis]